MTRFSANAIRQIQEGIQNAGDAVRGRVPEDSRLREGKTPATEPIYLGKPVASVEKGQFQDVRIWTGAKGAETATNIVLPQVYFRTSDITSTQFCYVIDAGGLEAFRADGCCEDDEGTGSGHFTHRMLTFAADEVEWSQDYSNRITPSGPERLTGISCGGVGPLGSLRPVYVSSTRFDSITLKAYNQSDGEPVNLTADFGAATAGVLATGAEVFLFGDKNPFDDTLIHYTHNGSALVETSTSADLNVRVNAMHGVVQVGLDTSGDTVVRGRRGDNNFVWSVNPTNGTGEAAAVRNDEFGFPAGKEVVVAYRNVTGDNLYLLAQLDGSTTASTDALGSSNLNAVEVVNTQIGGGGDTYIVVGGVGNGTNTVEAFNTNLASQWTYNTHSTVRAMLQGGNTGEIIVAGDRNFKNESVWVLNGSTGALINSYDHGEDVVALGTANDRLLIAGNRSDKA